MVLRAMHRRKAEADPAFTAPLRALEEAFEEAEARKAEIYRRGMLPARPTLIEHGPLRILVSATPSSDNLQSYVDTLAYHNVKHVVRVCEPTYDADLLRELGFAVHEWPFADGKSPPDSVVANWFTLLDRVFHLSTHKRQAVGMADSGSDSDFMPLGIAEKPSETVAVHCVAGLGRAPVLAALALVELGLDPYEAVGWMRALRRGAINATQMAYVECFSHRPPPTPVKPSRGPKSRSGSFVGALWPSLKAARPFRPRSPQSSRDSPRSVGGSPASGRRSPAANVSNIPDF